MPAFSVLVKQKIENASFFTSLRSAFRFRISGSGKSSHRLYKGGASESSGQTPWSAHGDGSQAHLSNQKYIELSEPNGKKGYNDEEVGHGRC